MESLCEILAGGTQFPVLPKVRWTVERKFHPRMVEKAAEDVSHILLNFALLVLYKMQYCFILR